MKRIFIFLLVLLPLISISQRPEMILVDGGTFLMGSTSSNNIDEKPEHQVTVSSFMMSKYEVTFEMFDLFCSATGYPMLRDGGYGRGKLPAINVSWEGAVLYCNWLSARFNMDKVYDIKVDSSGMKIMNVNWDANGFRLPTEAEWEFAAKGGTKGNNYQKLDEFSWFSDNSGGIPHEVGTKSPNSLGLYDIQGNAYEWCWDYYDVKYYSNSPDTDPRGPETGMNRVYKGGYFNAPVDMLNFTRRYNLLSSIKDGQIGIRLVQKVQ